MSNLKIKDGSTVLVTEPNVEMTVLERAVVKLAVLYPNAAIYPNVAGTGVDLYQYDDQAGQLSHVLTSFTVVIE